MTFEEYQVVASKNPVSLRNNLDRINFCALGLQEEAGKTGALLAKASASGKFILTQGQRAEIQNRLADILWYTALLCGETGIPMEGLAAHSLAQLQERTKNLDPDRR